MNLTFLIGAQLLLDQSKAFSINQILEFFKTFSFSCVHHSFNLFKSYSLSLFNRSRSQSKFLSFSFEFFARFFSSKAGKTLLPLLFHLFSVFMHFCHAFGEIFEPKGIWDFCWFKPFLWKLINGFLLWDTIKLIFVS